MQNKAGYLIKPQYPPCTYAIYTRPSESKDLKAPEALAECQEKA